MGWTKDGLNRAGAIVGVQHLQRAELCAGSVGGRCTLAPQLNTATTYMGPVYKDHPRDLE